MLISAFALNLILQESARIIIPKSAAVADGAIGKSEYHQQWSYNDSKGRIVACHDSESLYIAIESKEHGIASILLATGNKLHVLHASAALGTAVYSITGDSATCTQKFNWSARPEPKSTLVSRLAQFWKSDRWIANSSEVDRGPVPVREFRISLDLVKSGNTKLFVMYDTTAGDSILFSFPSSFKINNDLIELSRGFEVNLSNIGTSKWAVLELK